MVEFLDDPADPEHRPHHIFRCLIKRTGEDDIHAVAKENDHGEGDIIARLCETDIGPYIPKFYGVMRLNHPKPFIMLQDMNYGFRYPCTIDFKLGTRQWDLTASEKFRVSLIEKCNVSTSHSLGVRLVTATVSDVRGKLIENTTKSKNLRLSKSQLQKKINKIIPSAVRRSARKKLKDIRKAFADMRAKWPNMRMYSASALLCFDGADACVEPRVVLIDFAHLHFDIAAGGFDPTLPINDDGVLLGMDSLIKLLSKK